MSAPDPREPVPETVPNEITPDETMPDETALRRDLLAWFAAHARALPWRETGADGRRDPYRVWVSEVLLQQTQVARGRVYFERFLTRFPTVRALAAAPVDDVLKAWEGCGYYARARNLHRAAAVMAASGVPTDHEGWRALPGVGAYTAAAVSSLAFGEARAVMDGNVRRVLSRLYAVSEPTDRWAQGKADRLLDPERPGAWNEALMDLGATVCTPKGPRCGACPLSRQCRALASGEPGRFPAPRKRAAVREVRAAALLVGGAERAYLERREGALLGGLWGLPVEEQREGEGPDAALERLLVRLRLPQSCLRGPDVAHSVTRLGEVSHAMTHRRLAVTVYRLDGAPLLPLSAVADHPLSRLDHKALALLDGPPLLFAGDASAGRQRG